MEQKLIFLDIDGTLTEPARNEPPASAVEALRAARANGHKLVLCSGRNRGMQSQLMEYGFDGMVGSAGGYIEYGGQVIFDCPMEEALFHKAMDVLARSGVFCSVECRDVCYADQRFRRFMLEYVRTGGGSELARWHEQIQGGLGIRPMEEYEGGPVYKIVFMARRAEDLRAPMEALEDRFAFCIQGTDELGVVNGELINRAFNKGLALQTLCRHLNFPVERTVAFGDSMNDREMILAAGLGVCMGNGSQALKEVADAVCPPVTEDGLYRAFRRFGLI